jgi:hypothetical protein
VHLYSPNKNGDLTNFEEVNEDESDNDESPVEQLMTDQLIHSEVLLPNVWQAMSTMKFTTCTADPDVWMQAGTKADGTTYW